MYNKYTKKYSINKNVGKSNIKTLRISVNLNKLTSKTIESVTNNLDVYNGKLPLSIKLVLSSTNLTKNELRIMIVNECKHLVRITISFDNMSLSSDFISLSDSIDYISEIEDQYDYYLVKSITILNLIRDKSQLKNVSASVIESTLSKIDQSEIFNEEIRIMMQWFRIALKSDDIIKGFEKYYINVDTLINNTIVERIIKNLAIDTSFDNRRNYNMLKVWFIDQVIHGFNITSIQGSNIINE